MKHKDLSQSFSELLFKIKIAANHAISINLLETHRREDLTDYLSKSQMQIGDGKE